jgi:hypothetical protein
MEYAADSESQNLTTEIDRNIMFDSHSDGLQ